MSSSTWHPYLLLFRDQFLAKKLGIRRWRGGCPGPDRIHKLLTEIPGGGKLLKPAIRRWNYKPEKGTASNKLVNTLITCIPLNLETISVSSCWRERDLLLPGGRSKLHPAWLSSSVISILAQPSYLCLCRFISPMQKYINFSYFILLGPLYFSFQQMLVNECPFLAELWVFTSKTRFFFWSSSAAAEQKVSLLW